MIKNVHSLMDYLQTIIQTPTRRKDRNNSGFGESETKFLKGVTEK